MPAAGTRASIFANSRRCASENTKSRYTLPSAGWANALSTLPAQRVSIVPNGVCTVTAPYSSQRSTTTAHSVFQKSSASVTVPRLTSFCVLTASSAALTPRSVSNENR